jgi:GTP cyclohydrolase I
MPATKNCGIENGKGRAMKRTTAEPVSITSASFADLVREQLVRLGEDPEREGLLRTPERVEQALRYLTKGYETDADKILKGALFTVEYDEMVIVKDIEMFSLCEHHLLPFFGKVHVAYIPNGKVIGLSKIPRLIDAFSRRLQVQERLTTQIAECIQNAIHPQGVGVVIEARHLCMMMRGVEKQHSSAMTSSMLGSFRNEESTRQEFLSLLRQKPANGF